MTSADPDLRQRVASHPFLGGMNPQQLQLLADCAVPAHFAADEFVFRSGDPARGFYLLETGSIAVEGAMKDGPSAVIDLVTAGEPMGWSWIFEPFVCQYSARALEASTAIFFDADCLNQHRGVDLTLGHELLKRMSQVMVRRLNAARARLLEATAQNAANG